MSELRARPVEFRLRAWMDLHGQLEAARLRLKQGEPATSDVDRLRLACVAALKEVKAEYVRLQGEPSEPA